jgi:hypothetical protein
MTTFVPIGENEVRITNVWTVEGGNEFSTEHDPTPNWKEQGVPSAAINFFRLRIHAEAGRTVGAPGTAFPYVVDVKAVCITNPPSTGAAKMTPGAIENFGGATAWEYQSRGGMYTRDWDFSLPLVALAPGETGEIWQFYVILRHNPGANIAKLFACTGTSEPFHLLAP